VRHLQEESSESTNTSNEASGVERVSGTSELSRGGRLGVSTSASGVDWLGGNTGTDDGLGWVGSGDRARGLARGASRAGRLGANWVAGSVGGVRDSDGDGGGADAGLLRLGGLGGGGDNGLGDGGVLSRLAGHWVLRVSGLAGNRVGRRRGDGVDRVLRSLGGRLGGSRGHGVGRVLGGLGGRLGGSRGDWVRRVLRVGGGGSGSDNWGLSVSVAGNSGSNAGESSDGGNGVTHFG